MTSLQIILRKFKEGTISEEEASQIIYDLYNKEISYVPWSIPPVTYTNNEFPKFEVTCKNQ